VYAGVGRSAARALVVDGARPGVDDQPPAGGHELLAVVGLLEVEEVVLRQQADGRSASARSSRQAPVT
jgi:hypothetical protein